MRAGSDSREVRVKGRSPWATEVKNHLAPRYTYRKPGTLGMSGALLEVWIVTEAVRGSGAQDGWRDEKYRCTRRVSTHSTNGQGL